MSDSISGGVSHGSDWGPMVFNIFISDMGMEIEDVLIKCAGGRKLRGAANTLEDRKKIQKGS